MIIYQPLNGYCYNSDSFLLLDFISQCLKKYKNIKGEILDIGSGSGIIGILFKTNNNLVSLNQCEIQENFQQLSQINCKNNNIQTKMFKGDLLKIDFGKNFDIIISNPPFYHGGVVQSLNENKKIARYNDNMPLEKFISKVENLLTQKGKFFFCYDALLVDDIIVCIKKSGLNIEAIQFMHPKSEKNASLVMFYVRKNSKSVTQIFPPVIMFDKNGKYGEKINEIYAKYRLHSIKCEV